MLKRLKYFKSKQLSFLKETRPCFRKADEKILHMKSNFQIIRQTFFIDK
jgi:hypothetical protein